MLPNFASLGVCDAKMRARATIAAAAHANRQFLGSVAGAPASSAFLPSAPTGGVWNLADYDPHSEERVTRGSATIVPRQQWEELMSENDPVSIEPMNYDTVNDPPLIVSESGTVMLKSTYDALFTRGEWRNPTNRGESLFGIPGGTQADTPAKRILFDAQGRVQTRVATEAYNAVIPPQIPSQGDILGRLRRLADDESQMLHDITFVMIEAIRRRDLAEVRRFAQMMLALPHGPETATDMLRTTVINGWEDGFFALLDLGAFPDTTTDIGRRQANQMLELAQNLRGGPNQLIVESLLETQPRS